MQKYVRDYFSLVPNLLGYVLVEKSIAGWQRRTEFLEQFESPELIFNRRLSLGAPV